MQGAAMAQSGSPSLTQLLLAIALIVGLVWYAAPACTVSDPVWFLPTRLDQPASITIYRDGRALKLEPGSPGFQAVERALGDAVNRVRGTGQGGISRETLRVLMEGPGAALAVRFDQPQRIGGATRQGRPTRMLVPLEGPFADAPYIFIGTDEVLWPEPLSGPGVHDLRTVVNQVG